MRARQKVFWVFVLVGILFFTGNLLGLDQLAIGANLLLMPTLILYYRYKSRQWFILMVLALSMFYIRDIFLFIDPHEYVYIITISFLIGLLIIYAFAIVGFRKSSIHPVEWLSLLIMYGFLAFLFWSVSELLPQVLPSFGWFPYLYLLLLIILLAITFTTYLVKSHYASLWLMIASASLLVSELSLFFKMYVIADISVKVFFPLFHVLTYFALVQHALHRRRSLLSRFSS